MAMGVTGLSLGGTAKQRVDADGQALLKQAMVRFNLSARGYHRVLKVARSIADLAGAGAIGSAHIAEAIHYRRGLAED